MSSTVTLFHFSNDAIKVTVEARFDGDDLIIDGYDIGKQVEEYWGDSDYEYTTTVRAANLSLVYAALGLRSSNKQDILDELGRRFNTNSCYSEIVKFFKDNHIPAEGFSWT